MENVQETFTVSVFTRHSAECTKHDNPQWRRCRCRKSLYIYSKGKVTYKSAKTRSWEQAEQVAQAERDAHDPVKLREQELQERVREAEAQAAASKESRINLSEALDRWLASKKQAASGTMGAYRSTTRKIQAWADAQGIVYLKDVTPDTLDKWRGEWSPDADLKRNRLSLISQSHVLSRL
jgi:hypothetical protein